MKTKISLLTLFTLIISSFFGQLPCDNITLKNGDEVSVVIKTISENEIIYKKCSFQDGPDYIVKKENVLFIKYSNGTKEIINESQSSNSTKKEKNDDKNVKSSLEKKIVMVTKKDGNQIIGEIIKDDGRELNISTQSLGLLYVKKDEISEITDFSNALVDENGDYVIEHPFTTRYSFTTNAFPIKKGVNYSMISFHGPEIHFAVTNKFSLGAMTTWIGSPFAFVGKYTFWSPKPKINFAIGDMIGTTGYLNQGKGYGNLAWISATYGSRINNITLSGGYLGLGTFDNSFNRYGMMGSIAGIYKISKKAYFIFDSMISVTKRDGNRIVYKNSGYDDYGIMQFTQTTEPYPQNITFFFMPGVRFIQTESKAFQFSMAGVVSYQNDNSTSFPIPMISWMYKL